MRVRSALPVLFASGVAFLSGASAQDAALLNPLTRVKKASLRNFLDRPLFDPTRRPPPISVSPVVEVRAPVFEDRPPSMHLLGVIHGVRDMAIVRRTGEKKTTILRSGDYVGKWIVTVVPPIGVRLRNGDRAFEYALFTNLKNSAPIPLPSGTTATGPTDAVGMPTVMPSSWGMAPN